LNGFLYLNKIALMMAAASILETLENFYQTTRRYNPGDSILNSIVFRGVGAAAAADG
jgi:hypothetical protein